MSGIADAVWSKVVDGRREFEVFRKGVVSAVDKAVTPWLATINGRKMPFIDEGIVVGDVVFYVDQPDPFAWSRFDVLDEIEGSFGLRFDETGLIRLGGWIPWKPETTVIGGGQTTFPPVLKVHPIFGYDIWESPGVMFIVDNFHPDHISGTHAGFDATSYDESHGHTASTSPLQPYTDLADFDFVLTDLENAHTLMISEGPITEDIPPIALLHADVDYRPSGFLIDPRNSIGVHVQRQTVLSDMHSIRERVISTELTTATNGGKIYLPRIAMPGPKWFLIWSVSVMPLWHPTVILDAFDSSVPPYAYEQFNESNPDTIEWSSDHRDAWNVVYNYYDSGLPLIDLPYGASYPPNNPTPGFFPPFDAWEWWDAFFEIEVVKLSTVRAARGSQPQDDLGMDGAIEVVGVYSYAKTNATTDADHYPYFQINASPGSNLETLLDAGEVKTIAHAFLMNHTEADSLL